MNRPAGVLYEFESFLLDARKRLLWREGEVVPLTQKCFEVLLTLIERAGETVSKDELMHAVWPDTVVEEGNLTQSVSQLRKALGESRGDHRFVVTVQGRGYRFVANVTEVTEAPAGGREIEPRDESVRAARPEEGAGVFLPLDLDDSHAPRAFAPTARDIPVEAAPGRQPSRGRLLAFASVVLVAVLGALAYARWPERAVGPAPPDGIDSLAVLPFTSLGDVERDVYLETGMADALITKLSNLRGLSVRPTSAVIRYEAAGTDPVTAGRELGVDAVLEGVLQRADDRVRVTVRLLNTKDGSPVWAEKFDGRSAHIFEMQDAISESVARSLAYRLTGEDRRLLARHHTESGEAYQEYLRGRFFWNKRTADGLNRGVEHFGRAAQIDPGYALAHAGLADCYALLAINGGGDLPPREYFLRAKTSALKAIELDDRLAEAHTSLALVLTAFDRDLKGGEAEYRRAIELNPDYATAYHWYGWHLLARGEVERALEEMKRAQERDPVSLIINSELAMCYYYARRYDEALEAGRRTLQLDVNFATARMALGLAYEQKGMYGEAVAELEQAHQSSGGSAETMSALAHAYASAGDAARARRLAVQLEDLTQRRQASPIAVSAAYSGLGDKRRAREWAERALQSTDVLLFMLRIDPRLEGLAPAVSG